MKENLTKKQEGYIEGYAAAVDHLVGNLTGGSNSAKSYDPMTVEGNVMHSYAFNLKDGGRHHPLDDYESIEEITSLLLQEGLSDIEESLKLDEQKETTDVTLRPF